MTSTRSRGVVASVHETSQAHPDRVAVIAGDTSLTYARLDADSTALARYLAAAGVGCGDVVAFSLPRGHDAVIVMLACAKARIAYLPLDPGLPAARRDYILGDARPRLLLVDVAREGPDCELVKSVSVEDAVSAGRLAGETVPGGAEDADLAYLIYTSGSTGNPKAVEVTHGNLASLLEGTADLIPRPADVWLCAHSFAFDFSVWEIWGALVRGATVVVADHEDVRDPSRLLALIERCGVAVLSQTPGAFYRIAGPLATSLAAGRSRVRTVVFGGEALGWRRLETLLGGREAPEDLRLINMYGITEGTVHVTARSVAATDLAGVEENSIGTPLPHMRCSVLDARGRPAARAEPGELILAGAGVARGYRGQSDDSRFFEDPSTGEHSFRTGDIVSWSDAGELLYHHRKDRQVQVRGHRVECGEVEHRLVADPRVSAAAVLLVGEDLVAFVVGDLEPESRSAITSGLRTHLPDYMVPTRLVPVSEIPLTGNGKVDSEALVNRRTPHRPAWSASTAPSEPKGGPADPATEVTAWVRQLWEVVLGHDDFDDDENFFEVGGHSFTTVALAELLNERGHTVEVSDLFRHPTVTSLADRLRAAALPSASDEQESAPPPPHSPQQWRALAAFRRARDGHNPAARSATK